jgi:hypothetical protein
MKTTEPILTKSLRERLKAIMQCEIERLPETLAELEAKERINVICKLMPYVFPKVQQVHPKEGEPFTYD